MKLSEIRPCDNCGGKIVPVFQVIRFSPAVFDRQAVNETLGLAQFFGGGPGALTLAQVMGPQGDVVYVGMDDEDKELSAGVTTELFLCQDCYRKDINLAELAKKRTRALEEKKS